MTRDSALASGEAEVEPRESALAPGDDFSGIYKECFEAREDFLKTINEYLAKNDLPALASASKHDWSDVFVSVTSACDTLEDLAAKDKEVKGFPGRLKKAYRTLCDNAGIGAGFIGLIPNDQLYTAALCGGLKVIFNALQNAGRHRQAVYSALEELPMILNDRAASIEIYSKDEELHRRMAALYVATLKAYQSILQYFIGNKVKAGLKHLLPNTNEKLKEKIAEVKLRGDQFKERALVLLQVSQNESIKLQNESAAKQNESLELTSQVHADTSDIKGDTREIRSLLSEGGELRELFDKLKNFLDQQDIVKDKKRAENRILKQPESGPDINQVLDAFEYDPSLIVADCQKLINLRQNQNSLDDSKILFIIQSSELSNWLLRQCSTTLLISGRSISQQKPETSFFSAKLFACLFSASITYSNIVAISFYCSQHRDERSDPNANPVEMAMSLILQLLDSYTQFKPSHLQHVLDCLNPLDLTSVLQVFRYLVSKVKRETILFIVLDGISFFSSPSQRAAEMSEVMAVLTGIVREDSIKAIVKIIFTSPARAREFEDLFLAENGEIIDVPREVGQKALYRESQWEGLVLPTSKEVEKGSAHLITSQ